MSIFHKNLNTNLQSINDEESIKQENNLSAQPVEEEIEDSILQVNFCHICPLQFENKFIYDLHMSLVHKNLNTKSKSFNDVGSIIQENDFSTQPIKEETDNSVQDNILQTTKNASLSNKKKTISAISSNKREQRAYKCPVCDL